LSTKNREPARLPSAAHNRSVKSHGDEHDASGGRAEFLLDAIVVALYNQP
jgi:hypothetical protein